MKLSSLQNFIVVADELNISKAAQKLFITQQSLSESIARLEAEYHVRFFDRTPRLKLTYAGERMREFAEKTLLLERQFRNEMADVSKENIGTLVVGIRNSYNRMLLSTQLMSSFVEKHPNIMLKVTYGNSRDLSKKLLLGQIDLCIGSARILTDPNFITTSVVRDYYALIIPENILFTCFHMTREEAEQGVQPDFHYLKDTPVIVISGDSQTRAAGDHLLAEYQVTPPNVILECSGPDQGLLGPPPGSGYASHRSRFTGPSSAPRRQPISCTATALKLRWSIRIPFSVTTG